MKSKAKLMHVISIGLMAGLVGCAGAPQISSGEQAQTIMDGSLTEVENARLDLAYVDADHGYSRYKGVLLKPLDVNHVEVIQPSQATSIVNRHNEDWVLTDTDRQRLQEAFTESATRTLEDAGDFEVAMSPGPDVIVVEPVLTALAPTGPKADMNTSMSSARSYVYTEGAGAVSVAIQVSDSETGQVLAVLKDTRDTRGSHWGRNTSVTNLAEVSRHFSAWTRSINDGLVALNTQGPTQPATE